MGLSACSFSQGHLGGEQLYTRLSSRLLVPCTEPQNWPHSLLTECWPAPGLLQGFPNKSLPSHTFLSCPDLDSGPAFSSLTLAVIRRKCRTLASVRLSTGRNGCLVCIVQNHGEGLDSPSAGCPHPSYIPPQNPTEAQT